jgi:hypothetical protein
MHSNLPSTPEPDRDVADDAVPDLLALVATIRAHAFDRSATPADAMIDIRDAIREYDGEFADQQE